MGLALVAGSVPVAAAADSASQEDFSGFGYWGSSSFEDIFASITDSTTPESAAELFSAAVDDPDLVPGLDGLSEEDRVVALDGAAAAAASGDPLPAEIVALADTPWGLQAPILGQPIANGYAWQHIDRYYWENCEMGPTSCEVEDWMDFTYTIDPGGISTRLTVKTLIFGNRLTSHRVDSQVFRGAEMVRLKDGPQRQGSGTYVVTLGPHHNLTGYTFAASMQTSVWGPTGSSPLYWFRTGPTANCDEPTPGAWRCHFLD